MKTQLKTLSELEKVDIYEDKDGLPPRLLQSDEKRALLNKLRRCHRFHPMLAREWKQVLNSRIDSDGHLPEYIDLTEDEADRLRRAEATDNILAYAIMITASLMSLLIMAYITFHGVPSVGW